MRFYLPAVFKGTLPTIASPTVLLLLVMATEELNIPKSIATVLGLAIFFGPSFYLIRVQFARRNSNADVGTSWLLAECIGLLLLVLILLILWHTQS